ncbi:hypothetical protein PHMEG_00020066 [Phytophthora megakarya]|uniref:Uncharacterized protein n=1 Tax=Phytophthora megakarya TaxID=4795 RepID=A0A225VSN3_9STRA|nr:hypothetical protein PHMEG_00020066 [Phytophthora megakarya]
MRTLLDPSELRLPASLLQHYDGGMIDPVLAGMLLSTEGIQQRSGGGLVHFQVCHACDTDLSRGVLPKFAIRNGFYIVLMPPPIFDTTVVERLMTQLVSVVALTRVMRGGTHRSIRSHCMAFDATPGPPALLLPRSLDKCGSYKVVLAGSLTELQVSKIRHLHRVRGVKVQGLLQFYKSNNPFYAAIPIEQCDDIQILPGLFDEAPDSDQVGQVDDDQERVGINSDVIRVDSTEDENEIVERGLVFVNDVNRGSAASGAVDAASDRRFLVRHSSTFAYDSDGTIYAKMFPHLFPYGRGHPGDKRQIKVSQNACMRHYSLLSSRRFAEDLTFFLVAFDRLSTQKMFTRISLTCKRYPDLFDGYDTISSHQLESALCQNEMRQQGRISSRPQFNSPTDRFLRSVELGTGALWGSNLERQQYRREAFAYQTRFGQPALFVTLTPNVVNSFTMAQASMQNDSASARLFLRYIDAFIEGVLALDRITGVQKSFKGLFGSVAAYYGVTETQGGGTLHAHFILYSPDHPLSNTHCLGIRARELVTVILGPRMPYANDDSPEELLALRAKLALFLFKPFRALCDLVTSESPSDKDWLRAYASWESHRSPFDKIIMFNMDDYFAGREKATADNNWLGTDENETDGFQNDFADCDDLDAFVDSVYGENNGGDVFNNDASETAALNPARFPAIAFVSTASEPLLSSITSHGMLSKTALRVAKSFSALHISDLQCIRVCECGGCSGDSGNWLHLDGI